MKATLIVTSAWRLAVALAVVCARFWLPVGSNMRHLMGQAWSTNPAGAAFDGVVRLDAYWYARIAQHGYAFSHHHISSIGYFPLFPILIKAVSLVTGNVYVAGVLVSTACIYLAVWVLGDWLELHGLAARRGWIVALLLSFPFAFFFAAMYTESLYLALATATFYFTERRQWAAASCCTFLALLTRPTAVAILPALLVFAWTHRARGALAPVGAGIVAVGAFAIYQLMAFGTPLAYVRAQAAPPGNRTLAQGLSDLTLHGRPGMPTWYLAFMLFWAVVFLAMVPLVYRRFGPPYAVFTALTVLIPLASSLTGMERYVSVAFPVFAALGGSLSKRWLMALIVIGFWAEMVFAAMFSRGYGLF
jgi:hypothetical protein